MCSRAQHIRPIGFVNDLHGILRLRRCSCVVVEVVVRFGNVRIELENGFVVRVFSFDAGRRISRGCAIAFDEQLTGRCRNRRHLRVCLVRRRFWGNKPELHGLRVSQIDFDPARLRKPTVRPIRSGALLGDDQLPLFPGLLDPDDDLGARHVERTLGVCPRRELEDTCAGTIVEGWPRALCPDDGRLFCGHCRGCHRELFAHWIARTMQRQ